MLPDLFRLCLYWSSMARTLALVRTLFPNDSLRSRYALGSSARLYPIWKVIWLTQVRIEGAFPGKEVT